MYPKRKSLQPGDVLQGNFFFIVSSFLPPNEKVSITFLRFWVLHKECIATKISKGI